jgi:uncharacterized protein (TIGR02246 family)
MIVVVAAACQPAEQTDTSATAEKASTDATAEVRALRDQWVAAAERDDAAAVAGMYTDDAIFIGVEGNVMGRTAIEQTLAESFKTNSGLTVSDGSVEAVGDVVYSTGDWSQKATTPDGKTTDISGRYLVISRRQADGTWKIVRHVSMPNPAPQM